MRYYVQFNAGLDELITSSLRQDLKRVKIASQDDSSALLDCSSRAEDVAAISYLKNVFVVLGETSRSSGLSGSMGALTAQLKRPEFAQLTPKKRPFRIMASVDGELASLPRDAKARMESSIATRTAGRVETRGSGVEYWIIGRRDMNSFLLTLKMPKRKGTPTPKGALGAELSEMLVRTSKPVAHDIFLDPFGGKGSLVLARMKYPARRLVYSDTEYRVLRKDFQPELARTKKVQFLAEDARQLAAIENNSIDAIVTDPPWGEYEDIDMPYEKFIGGVAESFARVLRPGGQFVILMNRRQEQVLDEALARHQLEVSAIHRILVNGHPASVLVGAASQ